MIDKQINVSHGCKGNIYKAINSKHFFSLLRQFRDSRCKLRMKKRKENREINFFFDSPKQDSYVVPVNDNDNYNPDSEFELLPGSGILLASDLFDEAFHEVMSLMKVNCWGKFTRLLFQLSGDPQLQTRVKQQRTKMRKLISSITITNTNATLTHARVNHKINNQNFRGLSRLSNLFGNNNNNNNNNHNHNHSHNNTANSSSNFSSINHNSNNNSTNNVIGALSLTNETINQSIATINTINSNVNNTSRSNHLGIGAASMGMHESPSITCQSISDYNSASYTLRSPRAQENGTLKLYNDSFSGDLESGDRDRDRDDVKVNGNHNGNDNGNSKDFVSSTITNTNTLLGSETKSKQSQSQSQSQRPRARSFNVESTDYEVSYNHWHAVINTNGRLMPPQIYSPHVYSPVIEWSREVTPEMTNISIEDIDEIVDIVDIAEYSPIPPENAMLKRKQQGRLHPTYKIDENPNLDYGTNVLQLKNTKSMPLSKLELNVDNSNSYTNENWNKEPPIVLKNQTSLNLHIGENKYNCQNEKKGDIKDDDNGDADNNQLPNDFGIESESSDDQLTPLRVQVVQSHPFQTILGSMQPHGQNQPDRVDNKYKCKYNYNNNNNNNNNNNGNGKSKESAVRNNESRRSSSNSNGYRQVKDARSRSCASNPNKDAAAPVTKYAPSELSVTVNIATPRPQMKLYNNNYNNHNHNMKTNDKNNNKFRRERLRLKESRSLDTGKRSIHHNVNRNIKTVFLSKKRNIPYVYACDNCNQL